MSDEDFERRMREAERHVVGQMLLSMLLWAVAAFLFVADVLIGDAGDYGLQLIVCVPLGMTVLLALMVTFDDC